MSEDKYENLDIHSTEATTALLNGIMDFHDKYAYFASFASRLGSVESFNDLTPERWAAIQADLDVVLWVRDYLKFVDNNMITMIDDPEVRDMIKSKLNEWEKSL